ncbi:MAG: NAD kinase [Bacteroidetes bacterium]|nr:NAD kinase [Bacteroidota bacterium]
MTVAIYSRGLDTEQNAPMQFLLSELLSHKATVYLFEPLIEQLPPNVNFLTFKTYKDLVENEIEYLVSIGGDGTILDAVTLVRNSNIPILGINFGRLGFLASLSKNEIQSAVESLVNHSFIIDKRSLIHCDSNLKLFGETPFALNEFAIHKRDISPMIKIHTYINGEFLNTYWADGLIVSTPTGSTGYNLSCNGPILFPESSSFVITPVAPHNLNVRSIVISDTNIISFKVEGRTDQFICVMDARREMVNLDVSIAVKKENFTVSLIRLNENSFLSTLRNKLTWGMDKRN